MIHDNHLAQNKLLKGVKKKKADVVAHLRKISGHLGYQETVGRLEETKNERAFFVSSPIRSDITNDCMWIPWAQQND